MPERQELAMESVSIDFTNAAPTEENFLNLVKRVHLKASANCYIAFNTSANTDDYLLEDGETLSMENAAFTKLSVLGASGSGTLYVIAIRV